MILSANPSKCLLPSAWRVACLTLAMAGLMAQPASAQRQPRQISDQEHAWIQRQEGQNRSFEELLSRAGQTGRGRYIGVEPDISRNVYRFKFQRNDGTIVWVDMDGRTGRQISIRQ